MIKSPEKKRSLRNVKTPPLIVAGIVVVFAALVALQLTDKIHLLPKKSLSNSLVSSPDTSGGGASNSQKGEVTSKNNSATKNNGSQPGDTKSNSIDTETSSLLTPSGNFVSNHHPNLSGSPAPSTLTSVCTTTPGATCTISFMKDGVTKSLPTQTTDRGGSAYWNNWTLQSIGLSAGSWQVQAVATLDGQTKTASDAMTLVVSP